MALLSSGDQDSCHSCFPGLDTLLPLRLHDL